MARLGVLIVFCTPSARRLFSQPSPTPSSPSERRSPQGPRAHAEVFGSRAWWQVALDVSGCYGLTAPRPTRAQLLSPTRSPPLDAVCPRARSRSSDWGLGASQPAPAQEHRPRTQTAAGDGRRQNGRGRRRLELLGLDCGPQDGLELRSAALPVSETTPARVAP